MSKIIPKFYKIIKINDKDTCLIPGTLKNLYDIQIFIRDNTFKVLLLLIICHYYETIWVNNS
jgi:hypothetical protein